LNANPAIIYFRPGTTGWTSMFAGRAAVLWNPQILTADPNFGVRAGQFGFTRSGTPDLTVVVEAAPGVANAIWTPVGTNILTGGSSRFIDPQATADPARFYRLRSP
jgi:hypothetical protein